ncbi:hypothetical protein [Frankia sp. AvcI1]|uniref:hypothetical protein n=1 Tax=Frankia sp. AvcI1 TaxID=573496 RepID=UPI002118B37D|nr:hypothetical protein [Frankia sp. AvcI1]
MTATTPALGDWLWEIEDCRGSLDCWTAYAGRTVGPEEHWKGHLERIRITRRTPKRVYYDAGFGRQNRERSVDRAELETTGESRQGRSWWEGTLYAAEPPMPESWAPPAPDLALLKAAAAALHPDRGGDPDVFREAWARYERARDAAAS